MLCGAKPWSRFRVLFGTAWSGSLDSCSAAESELLRGIAPEAYRRARDMSKDCWDVQIG